jgi:PAS domain S-box-containing protein
LSLGQSPLPTLETLRTAKSGAWLWDGARSRIVWANAAGLALFDSQSVFDLIDRPFDAREAGVEAVAELTNSLSRGELRETLLHFPSVGLVTPLACRCNIHNLADGRPGLLVVQVEPPSENIALATEAVLAAFAHMPMAAAFISATGDVFSPNMAALNMFSGDRLGLLIGNAERAEMMLKRLHSTNLISSIEMITGLMGPREVRLTLQRINSETLPFAFMLLDDVTERRKLERELASAPAPLPPKTSDDGQAFEALARTLKDTIQRDSQPAPRAEQPEPVAKLPPVLDVIPLTITRALEQTGAAIAIRKNGAPAFVSQKAVALFGFETAIDLLSDQAFWGSLENLNLSQSDARLRFADHRTAEVKVTVSTIPWLSGPARQYVFEDAKRDIIEAHVAPAIPVPFESEAQLVQHKSADPDEDHMRILDIASDGIVTLDRDGKILSFSAGAEAIFGYRIAEVLEKPLIDFLSPDARKLFKDYLSGLEGPGLASVFNDGREMTAVVKQGGTVPIFITIGRLQSSKTRAAYAAVMRDITSWKRTERELREAKDVAEEASRQKSEFLARISHELRTPLNAIIGFSEVMRLGQFGDIKNEKYRDYINDIHASGGYLLSLINDLLDLSKIEAGKMELNFTAVSVADTTEHAVRLLQDSATRGRVLVRRSFAEKLPRVVADLRALRQVMLNLLSNAIKYTDPGGQVIISAQVTQKGELALSIKDTGIGMNDAQIKDALEPFKRIETLGRETQGTGLGLSLTKALVEANRARFDISSETGRGTLIEIVFPTTRVLAE